jgi:small subunit ribosomal protein S20
VANVPSAEKRNRQRIKHRARNLFHLNTMRTFVKRVRAALEEKDAAKAQAAFVVAEQHVDRAAQKGVIGKKTAARTKSRLAHAVRGLSA